jgi:peptide/nickel transport system permease protein
MTTLSQTDFQVDNLEVVSSFAEFWRRFHRNKGAVVAVCFLLAVMAAALLAGQLARQAPDSIDIAHRLTGPSAAHWLGTDELGRDQFSRLLYGARPTLFAAFFATAVGVVLGAPAGIVAGYFGGWRDALMSRVADALMSLPSLILAITAVAVLGPGLVNSMAAIGIVLAPRFYRLLRGATATVAQQTYITAGRAIGCSTLRTLRAHVLPNVASPLIVQISLSLSISTLAEASLSFIGLGVQPPNPSWGSMIEEGYSYASAAPLLMIIPGTLILLTALAYNVIGDGFRNSLGREVHDGR